MHRVLFEDPRAVLVAGLAGFGALLAAVFWPGVWVDGWLVPASARLAGLMGGAAAWEAEGTWALVLGGQPVLVTRACGAGDFCALAAAVAGWHLARRWAGLGGLFAAVAVAWAAVTLLAPLVNAARVLMLAYAHATVIPRLPEVYGDFLHLLIGVAVFLPALAAWHVALGYFNHVSRKPLPRTSGPLASA